MTNDPATFVAALASGLPRIDISFVDAGSLATGGCYCVIRYARLLSTSHPFISVQTSLGFASGTAIFPLALLALSALSSDIVHMLTGATRLTLSMAGVIALCAVTEEVARPQKRNPSVEAP